jgi:hypothetical protein
VQSSRHGIYELVTPHTNPRYGVFSAQGDFIFFFRSYSSYQSDPTSTGDYHHSFAGFYLNRDIQVEEFRQWVFEGPLWTALLLLAILPAICAIRIARILLRRKPAGGCRSGQVGMT